jgi:hypothetical protein
MSKTNVVVLNSAEQTSTLAFDNVNSLVNFVGHFLDAHNRWNFVCSLVLVHRNNQVVRMRFEKLGDLADFTRGIQVASWLFTNEGSVPNLNDLEWSADDSVSKVFDSSNDLKDNLNQV